MCGRDMKWQDWLGLACGAGLLVVLFCSRPGESWWLPRCMFHELTGLHCPGCGGTRSVWCLLHGKWLLCVRNNVLAMPLLVSCAVAWLYPEVTRHRWVGWSVVAVLFLFAVLRNIPCEPFMWLAPVSQGGGL